MVGIYYGSTELILARARAEQTGEVRHTHQECQVTMPYRFGRRARTLLLALTLPVLGAPCADGAALGLPAARAPEPLVEGRALWVNRFEYNSPNDIVEIMAKAASANFNVVYFQVRGQGDAY